LVDGSERKCIGRWFWKEVHR